VGHLPTPEGIARKREWFIRNRLLGDTVRGLAREARISPAAVTQGIQDFERWRPADLSLAFPHRSVRAEVARALRARTPRSQDERRRIEWLGRWGMRAEVIVRLVPGYSVGDVAGVLQSKNVGGRVRTEASAGRSPGEFGVDGFVIDRDHRRVAPDGQAVGLSEREYDLLNYLAQKPGEVIGPAELATAVWQRDDVSAPDVVKVYVSHLRKKLGGGLVHTVRGAGYRLGPGPDPEREVLLQVLTETNGNLSRAARRLGIPYSTFHYRVEKHGLVPLHHAPADARSTSS
jgi:DNA-binding response OmpR family regulator